MVEWDMLAGIILSEVAMVKSAMMMIIFSGKKPIIFRFNGTEYAVFVYYDRYKGIPESVIKYAGKSYAIDYTEVECALPVSRINCNGNNRDGAPLFDKLHKYYTLYKIPKSDIKFSLDMHYDIHHIKEEDD